MKPPLFAGIVSFVVNLGLSLFLMNRYGRHWACLGKRRLIMRSNLDSPYSIEERFPLGLSQASSLLRFEYNDFFSRYGGGALHP